VSEGIISAKNRTRDDVPVGEESLFFYKDFLQTTAAINVGNSGGPLINLDGEVIGINNSIQTAGVQANLGIGFAVPSNMARFVVANLLEHGHVVRGWLGVDVETLGNDDSDKWGTLHGARVIGVRPNTPAEKAGLEPGDVIVAFNRIEVKSRPQLQNLVTQTTIGSLAVLSVLRNRREMTLPVVIEELPRHLLAGTKEREEALMGFSAEELSKQNRERYGYPPQLRGIVITNVVLGSNADKAGLQPGDLILEIEDPTPDLETYQEKIEALGQRADEKKEITILLYVDRANQSSEFPRYFSLTIRPLDESHPRK
jgi:serine protease Do